MFWVLVFSFMYLVSVDPMDRSFVNYFQLTVEVAFRVKDSVSVGEKITLTAEIHVPDQDGDLFTEDYEFTVRNIQSTLLSLDRNLYTLINCLMHIQVADYDGSLLTVDTVEAMDVKVSTYLPPYLIIYFAYLLNEDHL